MNSQQIREQMRALAIAQQKAEKDEINAVVDELFSGMTKPQIRKQIKDMMDASPMMLQEVKRLLVDNSVVQPPTDVV